MHTDHPGPHPDGEGAFGRSTQQRRALLQALIETGGFVSAQRLHLAVLRSGHRVGLSTVYRTLAALSEAGAVDTVRDEHGERLFRHRHSEEHQHYLMCRACGVSSPLEASTVENWARSVAETSGFADVQHTVELTGTCAGCHDAG